MKNQKINTGAGKGDKPRNCFSKNYRDNFDAINWRKKNEKIINTPVITNK